MQAQLESVRSALNTLVETVEPLPSADAAMQTPPPRLSASAAAGGAAARGGGLEGLLEGISSRLANIEGMYTDMSTRLVRNITAHACMNACLVTSCMMSRGHMHGVSRMARVPSPDPRPVHASSSMRAHYRYGGIPVHAGPRWIICDAQPLHTFSPQVRVDGRVMHNENTVLQLQHLSAGAMQVQRERPGGGGAVLLQPPYLHGEGVGHGRRDERALLLLLQLR